jgi:hypothetical protein
MALLVKSIKNVERYWTTDKEEPQSKHIGIGGYQNGETGGMPRSGVEEPDH